MGRATIVTGGASGIGAATSIALKSNGYDVVATCSSSLERAAAFSEETGIAVLQWDVADFEACRDGVSRAEALVGPIEVLVNNAGITDDAFLHKMTPDHWNRVISVDLSGCFNMCRHVIEGMRERRYGRIINISSLNGLSGQIGQTNYAAAKAGVIGFTKALALECAHVGVTVNAVAPGYTDTPMVSAVRPDILKGVIDGIPIHRLARPDEIARGVVFLASDDAGFITGETLSINGGKYMQ